MIAMPGKTTLKLGYTPMPFAAGRRQQILFTHGQSCSAPPESLGKGEQTLRHAVVGEEETLIGHADIVPQTEDAAQCFSIGGGHSAGGVQKVFNDVAEGIPLVEITHVGVDVAMRIGGSIYVAHLILAPHLSDGRWRGLQTGIPYHHLPTVLMGHFFAKADKGLRIVDVDFVASDVNHGAILARDFAEKFVETFLQHLHPLL